MKYSDSKAFSLLTKEIRKVDLTTEELTDLHTTYFQTRSEAIMNRLITYHLRYVITIVNAFKTSKNVSFDDLIGYGSIGLVRALQEYDPTTGFKFLTFAKPAIIRQIVTSLKHEDIIRMKSTAKTMVDNGELPAYTFKSTSDTMFDSENCTVGDTLSDSTFDGLFDFDVLTLSDKEQIFWSHMKTIIPKQDYYDIARAIYSASTSGGKAIKITETELGEMFGITKQCIGQKKQLLWKRLAKDPKLKEWFDNNYFDNNTI